ncbi:MAG: hypothetical protein ABSB88_12770 [Bryobacteraceae bacterium]
MVAKFSRRIEENVLLLVRVVASKSATRGSRADEGVRPTNPAPRDET